jgi:peroxiredoxin
MSEKKSRDRLTYVLIAVIIVMGVEIIYLVFQNRILKNIISDPTKYFQTMSKDETVPPFTAQDINGNELSVSYSGMEPFTMLIWFGPTCSSCENNIPFWKRIYGEFHSERLRFLGMFIGNPSSGRELATTHDLEFPIICATQRSIVDLYKGHILPQTMLITPEGAIEGVWPGILNELSEIEIIEALETLHY